MAVPKKKTSVSKKGLRRAGQHHKLYRSFPVGCKNCGDIVLPHRVCSSCGHYNSKEIVTMPVAEETSEEQVTE